MFSRRAFLACLSLSVAACAEQGMTDPAAAVAAANVSASETAAFPDVIALDQGFSPEGIAAGTGTTLFVGSIPSGAVARLDALTGARTTLVPAQAGRQASGLKHDARTDRLFVAGGLMGQAYVYNATTGADVATYQLVAPFTALINDVVVTRDAAYFTDSFNPAIYKVPLGLDGSLAGAAQTIPLGGDWLNVPGQLNGNGIVATPDGKALVMVNSATGRLYRVDPATGVAREIDGPPMQGGDGMLLEGSTLYVVQGFINRIAVLRLDAGLAHASLERTITSGSFAFPTTIAPMGSSLYAVNGHFDVAPPPAPAPTVNFEVVRVAK